ncbi:DUF6928 family protein [Kitasatospora sp. NPDC015120]|uniref:DUF6928 family protein n=1 Tax=Kitasatospora sp. NPDC015120 TaxID=3364023 RepID=UPI0036F465F9
MSCRPRPARVALPFHPLGLGEEALRFFFGFVLEGVPGPEDVDPYEVVLQGFRLTGPGGPAPEEEEAAMRAAISRMGPPRTFTYGPDGTMAEAERS